MAFCSTSNLENTRPWNQSVLGQRESKPPGTSFRVEQAVLCNKSKRIKVSNAPHASLDVAFTSLSLSRGETGRLGMVALLALLHKSYGFNGKCLRLPKKQKNRRCRTKSVGWCCKRMVALLTRSVSCEFCTLFLDRSKIEQHSDSSRSCHWQH